MAEEIRVLVVDEDVDVLELTKTFLERESDRIKATTEKSPETAADSGHSGDFDAIVSDLRMPEMDGIELCEAVREAQPEIPFFLFTAADLEDVPDGDETLTGIVQKGTGTDHYRELAEQIEAAVD